jgi:hypothetical protein
MKQYKIRFEKMLCGHNRYGFGGRNGKLSGRMNEEWYLTILKRLLERTSLLIGWSRFHGQVTTEEKIGIKEYTESYFYT